MAERPIRQLLAPCEDEWRLVELPADGASAAGEPLEPPFGLAAAERTLVCLPSSCFSSVPLRIEATAETEGVDGMARLQLEKLGVADDQRTADEVVIVPLQTGGDARTYHAVVLDETIPEELCIEHAGRFEPAVHMLDLPDNALTLYRECGQLVAALTIGGKLCHFQPLGVDGDFGELANEVSLLLASLADTLELGDLEAIHVRCALDDCVLQELADSCALPVRSGAPPGWREPAEYWGITPRQVGELRQRTRRRRRTGQLAAALAAAVVVALLALAAHLVILNRQAGKLERELAAHAGEVERTRETASLWRRMELALDPDLYPLERLYQATQLLPDEGVRLTVFEQRGGDVVIAGEASSTPAAIKFSNDLRRNPAWSGFSWEIPQPKILPNNSAQFRITARRASGGEIAATTP